MTCPVEGCGNPSTTGSPECVKHKFAGGIRVNGIALFRHDREHGLTQAQKAREMFDGARADKKQIARVRGRRTATEVRRNGRWEKV
jgi:hypothetical protein